MQQLNLIESLELVLLVVFFVFLPILFCAVPMFSKLVLLFIIFAVFIINTYKIQVKKMRISFLTNKVFVLFIVFFIYLVFNTFFVSKIIYDSKVELINFVIYTIVFFVILLVDNEKLTKSLLYSFFVVIIYFLVSYISSDNDREKIIYYFFYNPNIFAGYCLINLFFSYVCVRNNFSDKIIILINCISSLLLLIFMKNYAALFVIFLLGFFLIKKYYKISFITIIIIIFFLANVIILINYQTFVDRTVWFIAGVRIFLKNIFLGIGLNNFKHFYLSNIVEPVFPSVATIYLHNYFLQLALEIGVLGILLKIIILFMILRFKNNNLFFYPIIAILILNFFDYNLVIPQNSILLYTMLSGYVKNTGQFLFVEQKNKYIYFFVITVFFLIGFYMTKKYYDIEMLFKYPDKNNLKQIINIDKTCWQAYADMAKINIAEKNLYLALDNLFLATKYNSQYSEAYFYIALIYKKLNINKNFVYKNLSKAIKLNPKASDRYIKYFNSNF